MRSLRLFGRLPLIAALLALPVLARAQERLDLTLLHTNDLHGHVLPHFYAERGRGEKTERERGGLARIATRTRQLRRQLSHPTLLIDLGDTATRGPMTNAYEGLADIEAMNAAGYDLGVVGNNEFKLKDGYERDDASGAQEALRRLLRRSRFRWVCANAFDQSGGFLPGVSPFVVREFQGVRIGFLGLTAPRSAGYPQTRGWKIVDPIEAAQTWIPVARKECDLLIAVTHIGVNEDRKLVAATSGIDAVVGGDSHTFLYEPVVVKNADGVPVPIVQAGEFGVNLGRFDLHFARAAPGWRLAGYQYRLLPIDPKTAEAPEVRAVAERYAGPLRAVVARLPDGFLGQTEDERTRATTKALCEALRRTTGADLALNPRGAGFFNHFRRSEITRFDLFAALPFKNRAVTTRLTGQEIRALRAKAPGTIAAGDTATLEDDRTYTVALVDFVAADTYALPAERLRATGRDIRDLFTAAWPASPR